MKFTFLLSIWGLTEYQSSFGESMNFDARIGLFLSDFEIFFRLVLFRFLETKTAIKILDFYSIHFEIKFLEKILRVLDDGIGTVERKKI